MTKRAPRRRAPFGGETILEHDKRRVEEIFGNQCYLCGKSTENMVLAHLFYEDGQFQALDSKVRSAKQNRREAVHHPERFVRMCNQCNVAYDCMVRNGGYDWVRGAANLFDTAIKRAAEHKQKISGEKGSK